MTIRTPAVLLAGLTLVALISACGSTGTVDAGATTDNGTTSTPDRSGALDLIAGASTVGQLPEALGQFPSDAVAGAARTSDASLIMVVTTGSSTCPQIADTPATEVDGTIDITFAEPDNQACTMDLVPTTTVVELPASTADTDLRVKIGDWGTVTLPTNSTEPAWILGS